MQRRHSPTVPPLASLGVAACAILIGLASASLRASDVSEFGSPSQEYLTQQAELEALVSSRDVDLYEVNFQPLDFDEIVLQDRLAEEHVYDYLTFRLRNQVSDATRVQIAKPSRYNEVLQSIANQFDFAKVSQEGGGKLTIDGVQGPDGVIVERQCLTPHARTVDLTVVAYDEHGSRLSVLQSATPGSETAFDFRDPGDLVSDGVYTQVRDAVEERVDHRLHTVDEIRKMVLPVYDPTKRDAEGVAEGEVYGVILFPRLSVYGHHFTIEIHGLSNKFRIRGVDPQAGQMANYADMRLLRRTMVLHYDRPGDEYFRNLDRFLLTRWGWEWVPAFERLDTRRAMAYATYYLNNIADDQGKLHSDVEKEYWQYYDADRAQHPGNDKLPDLEKTLQDR
jgi:hypothetical protein